MQVDLKLLRESLNTIGAQRVARDKLFEVERHLQCFGFHLAKLDIRQNSAFHEKALSQILVLAYQLANLIARDLVEALLAKRASAPTQWGNCPKCGRKLESKGRKQRQLETMIGRIRWKRASGRCRQKCAIGQQTPLDVELGIEPYQKTERRLQRLAILLAIFVPFESAAMLLNQLLGIQVSATSIWNWVQEKGSECMRQLEAELNALSSDQLPDPEGIDAQLHNLMLLIGADGVMVAFRPEHGSARGRTRWREVKVGIFARLQQYKSRAGQLIPRLTHHRVVAVLGDIDDLAVVGHVRQRGAELYVHREHEDRDQAQGAEIDESELGPVETHPGCSEC